jgi:yecA family protein
LKRAVAEGGGDGLGVGSRLELDGYLTGVLVAPRRVAPSRWIAGLWGEDNPVFDDEQQLTAALGPVKRSTTRSAPRSMRASSGFRPSANANGARSSSPRQT